MARKFKPIGPVDYSNKTPPEGYRCSNPKCRAPHGVKLWRQYQTIASEIELLCGPCGLKDQKKSGEIDSQGCLNGAYDSKTDQIGWLMPAVPTEDGSTFWGYTSVPPDGCIWWRDLPTYKVD